MIVYHVWSKTMFTKNGDALKCSKCKKTSINLISITDDEKGRRYCKPCKKIVKAKLLKRFPNLDFSKYHRLKNSLKEAKVLNTS